MLDIEVRVTGKHVLQDAGDLNGRGEAANLETICPTGLDKPDDVGLELMGGARLGQEVGELRM